MRNISVSILFILTPSGLATNEESLTVKQEQE